jgi:hypothetical protein
LCALFCSPCTPGTAWVLYAVPGTGQSFLTQYCDTHHTSKTLVTRLSLTDYSLLTRVFDPFNHLPVAVDGQQSKTRVYFTDSHYSLDLADFTVV